MRWFLIEKETKWLTLQMKYEWGNEHIWNFDNLRYHHENEVVEFKKAENNFDFDDMGKYSIVLGNIKMYEIWIEG